MRKETLRFHPRLHQNAPFLLPRECNKKCKHLWIEVPEKARIIVNAWAIARDLVGIQSSPTESGQKT